VGALIIFFGIYFDPEDKFKLLSRNSDHKIARACIYPVIGFIQAIVLGVVLIMCLGLKVNNIPMYYLSCCLISMVSISIVQFLIIHLKDLGKFLAIALLILQLTSCGGTFPMETLPRVFNVLYPFMPMTYSVALLKQAICGADAGAVGFNAGILVALLVLFIAATMTLSFIKRDAD
jgi:putative membrane protein